MGIDVGLFTETKFCNDHYTRSAFGYNVFATTTTRLNQGGVALVHRHSDQWQVESEMRHGPNVVSFLITTGQRRFFFVGVYIPPADMSTLNHIRLARDCFADMPMFQMGDLNVNLDDITPDNRAIEIIALTASLGLEDMASHFRQRAGYHHGDTWHIIRDGQLVLSKCDYIMAPDRRYFQYIRIREPRYNTDHLMVVGGLLSATQRENFAYLRGRKKFPLAVDDTSMSEADMMLRELRGQIDTQDNRLIRKSREPWISDSTWKLIDLRASRCGNQTITPIERRRLNQCIRRAINKD
jgi:hypothetical protein